MGCLVDQLADSHNGGFSKPELVLVAEAIGLAPTSDWEARRIVEVIMAKIDAGAKLKAELQPRVKDLLTDFLYVAYGVETLADVHPPDVKGGKPKVEKEAAEKVELPEKLPDCWSYADDENPACKRCKIYAPCAQERIANLPSCFGKMHDRHNPECQECMEGFYCLQGAKEAK